jgi:hypothetical protein
MHGQIPKRIIQFHIGKQIKESLRNRAAMSNLKLLNPGFEYLFFDDAHVQEFIQQEFPQYREVFDSFQSTIERCDFFRYLAIYRLGGFYFDLDVLLASGVSDLLEQDCVFPFERVNFSHFLRKDLGMDWQIGNYAFGARPGHPFLDAIIKNCVRGQKDRGWVKPMMRGSPPLIEDEYFVLNSTGPGLVSRTLAENPDLAKTVTVLFPDDVCDVRNWNLFGDYGVHLMDSSWREKRSFVRQRLTNYCRDWIQQRRIKDSRKLGKSRHHPSKLPVSAAAADELHPTESR